MSMLSVVAIASLILAVVSFLIFGYQVYLRRQQVTKQMKIAEDSLDLAKLIKAFAKLADSLGKRWGRQSRRLARQLPIRRDARAGEHRSFIWY